jgi:hypothetical protein
MHGSKAAALFATLVVICVLSGCGTGVSHTPFHVVGDGSMPAFAAQLSAAGLQVQQGTIVAGQRVILVQDATVGPTPVHTALIKSVKERGASLVLVVLTRTDDIKDGELLDLEELELREQLNAAGLNGDNLPFARDSTKAPPSVAGPVPQGIAEIKQLLNQN